MGARVIPVEQKLKQEIRQIERTIDELAEGRDLFLQDLLQKRAELRRLQQKAGTASAHGGDSRSGVRK